ncbi:MAG: hypothetical protein B9S32_12785, partial [Verrucomicrobia bacterium Tous-C9LFEB]
MILLVVWQLSPSLALANPTGGVVAGGSASIAGEGTSAVTVTQNSGRAIINWQNFSIGAGELTKFLQPDASSAVLNRVTGGNLSAIYGTLQSNGQVYLINSNGVLIGASGVINTGGFVASTFDVGNAEFMAGGNLHFVGSSDAKVINQGIINAVGGNVYLIAAQVSNEGEIRAPNGRVGLAGGHDVMLQQSGDERLFIVPGSNGAVNNVGTIHAVQAELKAAGGNAYALAINNGGTIRATGVSNVDGKIKLFASSGTTKNTGTLVAKNADGRGGFVETSGESVSLSGSILTGEGGLWLIDPTDLTIDAAAAATIVGALNVGTNVLEQTTASGTFGSGTTSAGNGDIIVASAIDWTGTGTLTLDSYHDISIAAAITGTNGGLVLKAGNTISASSTVSVGTFTLQSGNWRQLGASLPTFYAKDFRISGGTFLRALGGDGSSGTPYQLTDIYGVQGISTYSTSNFILANTIDATGTATWNSLSGFNPIAAYSGTFDGAGYAISGLTISRSSAQVGLFGANSGILKNIGLVNASVRGGNYTGGLVGSNSGTISVSYVTGTVTGSSNTGGVAGYNSGTLSQVNSSANVRGANYVGGLVGYNYGSLVAHANIFNSYATGNVTGAAVGGIAGYNYGTISNSYATGAVSGSNRGGLVGYNEGGTFHDGVVNNSYWDVASTGVSIAISIDDGNSSGLTGLNASTAYNRASYGNLGTWVNIAGDYYKTTNSMWFMIEGSTRPFLISEWSQNVVNSHQLQLMSYNLGATYTLAGNINLAEVTASNSMWKTTTGFSPIGNYRSNDTSTEFTGQLYGKGFVINALTINRSSADYVGLIGSGNGGAILNKVALTNVNIRGNNNVGGLVGTGTTVTISNSSVTGTVSGTQGYNIGGLVGSYANGEIYGSTASATVSGNYGVGGLVGQNSSGTISGSFGSGSVTGQQYVGGVAGSQYGIVNNSSSSATVTGSLYVGGLVGYNGGTISGSLATGAVRGGDEVGGLVGHNTSLIFNSSVSAITVTGASYVGGLVGYNDSNSTISISSATGTVTGGSNVGGLVGLNTTSARILSSSVSAITVTASGNNIGGFVGANAGTFSGGLVTGTVTGGSAVGGLIGSNTGTISNSSVTGTVSGTSSVGGLVGANTGSLNGSFATGTVTGSSNYTGGLVGHNNNGSINNSTFSGTVSGNQYVGGLAGYYYGTLANAYATGTVIGTSTVGGLVGLTGSFASISNSSFSGTVSGSAYIGGLVGVNYFSTISNSSAVATVTGNTYVGGLVGYNNNGTISNSLATSTVSGNSNVGGLVGMGVRQTITGSYAVTRVTGNSNVGGLVGYNESSSSTIRNSSASGTISGTTYLGGLVGMNAGAIINSYATGTVTGSGNYVGGLVAYNNFATISNSSASTAVTGAGYVGGLAGANTGTISGSYATGSVRGTTYAGGLVGENGSRVLNSSVSAMVVTGSNTIGGLVGNNTGTISGSTATGTVTGGNYIGGLAGSNTGTVTNSSF